MSLGTLLGATALTAGVSFVSILQADDWARISIHTQHYFKLVSLPEIHTRIWFSVPSGVLVSRQLIGKCKALTYLESCR